MNKKHPILAVDTTSDYARQRIEAHREILMINREYLQEILPNINDPNLLREAHRVLSKLNKWIGVIRIIPRRYYLCPNELLCDFSDSEFVMAYFGNKHKRTWCTETAMNNKISTDRKLHGKRD